MTRNRLFIIGGLSALALAIGVPAALSHGPGHGDHDGGPRGDRHAFIIKKLGLDDKQAAALKTLHEDMRADATSIHEQIQAKRDAMKALWLAPNPDRNQILAAEREIGALQGQLAERRVDFIFAVKGVLNAEQFAKFVELQKERGFGRHGGWHHGGGMRHGPPPDGSGPPEPSEE